ncbi:MurR/RpiR family transcriptional regulator [Candidatus Mycoplasma pogonae]
MFKLFIDKQLNQLTATERKIIEFIEASPEAFYNNSIKQIAHLNSVSISLVSGLAAKMGFSSLKDLQLYVYHKHLDTHKALNNDENNLHTNLLNYLYHSYSHSISETMRILDSEQLEKIASELYYANRILLYGVGSSHLASRELAINFQKMGKNAIAFADFHGFLLSLASVEDQSTKIILLSKSCATKEIQFAIDLMEKNGIEFILITANKTKKQQHDKVILYETLEQKSRFVSISSKIAQQFTCDYLFKLIQTLDEKLDNKFKKNLAFLEQWNRQK